ncbi:hypothetical protein WJX73_009681 [Symbiochloris irregularis]|uniref:Uncharacterized protein n=1 Tax=Symbiochloris irregularis TaxID=706552 RepID=A0AAW1P9S0_9CHLO
MAMGGWDLLAGASDDACNRYFDLDSAACADGRDILDTTWIPGPRERQLASRARLAEDSEVKLPLDQQGSALLAWHLAQRSQESSLQQRRVRSASVFLSSQPQQGPPSLVPQILDRAAGRTVAQTSTSSAAPYNVWEGMTKCAKRHCRWERSAEGGMLAPGLHQNQPSDQCAAEGSFSCISSDSAGIRTDATDAPDSPQFSSSHAWPSVLVGGASPFSMPKVCSLDGNSLFMINQRLQASRDSASYPKTPPQQMPPPKPAGMGQIEPPPQDNVLDTGGSWDDEEGLVTVRYPYHDVWA